MSPGLLSRLPCRQTSPALKVLKSCGVLTEFLDLVYRDTMLARVIHASPCWWVDLSAADREELQAVLARPPAGTFGPVISFRCLICVIKQTVLSSGQLLPTSTMSSGLFFLSYGFRPIISGVGLNHLLYASGTNSPSCTF